MNNIESVLANENRGARILSFDAETEVRLKAGHPFGSMPIIKKSKINALVNFDYGRAWTKRTGQPYQRQKEAWYSEIRKNGKRIPLVSNKDGTKRYVRAMILHTRFNYITNGKLVKDSEVQPWLPNKSENPVKIACFEISNVKELRLRKQCIQAINGL